MKLLKKIGFVFALLLTISLTAGATTGNSVAKSITKTLAGSGATLAVVGAAGSIRKLEQEAHAELSNYDGEEYEGDYEGDYEGYTGSNDDFLDFGGSTNRNVLAAVEGHNFTFTIVNSSDTAKEFYILPSLKNYDGVDAPIKGTMMEGNFAAINDTGSTKSLTATGDTYGTVDFLRRFVENNPTYVKAFQITSTTAIGVSQFIISVEEVSPFSQQTARQLKPSLYQGEGMFNDKILNVPAGFDMNDQCILKSKVAAQSTLQITVICGAVLNTAGALKNKRQKASRRR